MHAILITIILFMMSPEEVWSRRRITDSVEADNCHRLHCGSAGFNCQCEEADWRNTFAQCIPVRWLCDGWKDCTNNADEIDCTCPAGQYQCGADLGGAAQLWYDQYNCIPDTLFDDGILDCFSRKDEYSGSYKSCDLSTGQCDGWVHCSDRADEINCECPSWIPNRCACNRPGDEFSCSAGGWICYSDREKCNGKVECIDGSDEDGCTCTDEQFTCQCYRNNPKTCSTGRNGCIPMSYYHDGSEDCYDGSDEQQYFKIINCGDCHMTVGRLDFIEQCEEYFGCNNNTCVIIPALNCTDNTECNASEVICTSHCDRSNTSQLCDTIFQCENGYLEIAHNFCDGKIDCPDGSDEILNDFGFKCSTSFGRCVLPQRNLHDNVAQCQHESDLCLDDSCFECLDGKLNISTTQLCDGVIDCFDLSDECLCQIHLDKRICLEKFVLDDPFKLECGKVNPQCRDIMATSIEAAQCKNPSSFNQSRNATSALSTFSYITCSNKFNIISAVMCNGRPECMSFEDECLCDDPPSFCNDSCHDYYPLGDRYCDGIIDEAWKFINDSSCPEGFDEKSCPKRFACKAGNLVNIDITQVCDGIINCDDGSDESSCQRDSIFSSEFEMIENVALRSIFWIIATLVIIGNAFVIISTARLLCKEKMGESQKFNHILILNLSFSDILMGFYLLIISIKSAHYSGYYGSVDYWWRSSLECSIIGSLAVISSGTSCFIMTIITAFRLYNIFNPFTARTAKTLKWKFGIVVAWSFSLLLALLPVFKVTSSYFVHKIWFSNKFSSSEVWDKNEIMTFACRLASLSNNSINANGDAWESTEVFLNTHFSEYSPKGEFGYYGETSICMPRIYVHHGDHAWIYSFTIITFNFISFLFVAISYIALYFKTSHRPIQTSRSDKQNNDMQKRITRLIATDFACWIPICIMVYVKTAGVEISDIIYIVTAGLLLPVNSALNPLLYSSIVEQYFKQVCFQQRQHVPKENKFRNID